MAKPVSGTGKRSSRRRASRSSRAQCAPAQIPPAQPSSAIPDPVLAKHLQEISTELIEAGNVERLYEKLLDAAVAVMRSDTATMQLLDRHRGELQLTASRGLGAELAQSIQWVGPDRAMVCGEALRTGDRILVSDLEQWASAAGISESRVYREAGIRAAQSTPLRSRSGALVGMLSTHWKEPHQPEEDDLWLLDMLARQVADLIERKRNETALAGQKRVFELIAKGAPLADVLTTLVSAIEEQTDGLVGSVLVRKPGRDHFSAGVAPHLPDACIDALRSASTLPPYLAPCSMAAHRGEAVFTPDIANDGRWAEGWRELALAHGLRACFSAPIFASDGSVLGSFSLHARETQKGPFVDPPVLETATHLAGIAVERRQAEEALREANHLKDEFLATLSHELRTPLNAILGWLRLLSDKPLSPAQKARALQALERNARIQSQLVDTLLDVSDLVTGKLSITPAPVDLEEVIRGAVETAQTIADAQGIELTLDLAPGASPRVNGDAERLRQMIWHLLSNGLKFTADGGRVAVMLRSVDAHAEIVVVDTGQGIEADFLPHVFDQFRQEEATLTRTRGGLGVGLALVRFLTEAHGGTVAVESAGRGQGTTFTIRLPLEVSRDEASCGRPRAAEN
jgi:signal transduction histidine kinase